MATDKGMSGLDLAALTSELQSLLPLWVGKIYQYDNTSFGFRFNGEDKARHLFFIEIGRRAHRVPELPPAPKNPSGYSMYLRKYLDGGKILSVRQKSIERVVILEIGKGGGTLHLIIELFDEGNLIITDESFIIQNALKKRRFREREIVSGERYDLEGIDLADLTPGEFGEILRSQERDLVRAVAVGLMFGGVMAEELCLRAGVEKAFPTQYLNEDILSRLYLAYRSIIGDARTHTHPVIDTQGCWPFPLSVSVDPVSYPTFSDALTSYYPLPKMEEKEEAKREVISREERIRRQQKAAIEKFETKIRESERAAELIYEHYTDIQQLINILSSASEKMSWQEIAKVIRTADHPAAKLIASVNPADASVVIDLGMKITISVQKSVEGNVGVYYDQMKKFRSKREGAIRAMNRTPPEKKERATVPKRQKPKWYHRFRWFETSDGVLVIGGRDADQNEDLVKKYMEGGDTFVHADVHGGSVVIVKGKTDKMDEVAQFAASYSNFWKGGYGSGDVYAAAPGQVSKTPESGEFIAKGAFVIRGERQYYRNAPLELAVGVVLDPGVAVIGGPVAAVEKRAKYTVRITPGTFEPNDIAKKVVRMLRDHLPATDAKILRSILSTEAVAAFIPAGGSDISKEP
ncbi:fibronectin-binding domain-containing protein [Methanocalculus taiwanensis]|uniref:Fibronectin-binding domain-containing protein n=1 Tax=Methanocalculus taiwanensis TaxID=106207 RepID=A0ABD4THG6_9EURY|nr:ribosome rescue protein RqcH [Methanocalculus taiwanensis]MCQ1537941.1 fibronectin-binding domain-containing protein [Methanocalculus taiwanensis]